MKDIILFDLGGTLVQYFSRSEFHDILKQAIMEVYDHLYHEKYINISLDDIWESVDKENHESEDYSVRQLEDRLSRIFHINDKNLLESMCRRFMIPIFRMAVLFDDTLPALRELKANYKMGIVSNTTWGSPAELWREEIRRFGIDRYMDTIVFCRDVGWRKPDRRIFSFALDRIQASPAQCIFVGDDMRWDIAGSRASGIDAILIDRKGIAQNTEEKPIKSLLELFERIK